MTSLSDQLISICLIEGALASSGAMLNNTHLSERQSNYLFQTLSGTGT
jgi:hypothetical protein